MQDYQFFITASYSIAAIIMGGTLAVTLWQFFSTKKRLDILKNRQK